MGDAIRRFLARHRRHWLVRKAGHTLGYYHQGYENQDYNPATNGERFVLETLARVRPEAVILDVGAHHGEWARVAAAAVPRGTIHSFEVIPGTFRRLQQECADLPRVTPHQLGLGETDGQLEFSVVPGREELTSGVPGVHGRLHQMAYENVRCPVVTGSRFCREQGIAQVDFLKLDVEGLEPAVLRGFLPMLETGSVRMIQFEYGQINLQARFFLGDYYELLGAHGFRLGKVFPGYVDFRDYHFTQDNLMGPNYLAVNLREEELIRRLAGVA